MRAAEERLSTRRDAATEGGGTEGALATITSIGFVDEFDYGGRSNAAKTQAALRVVFEIDGFDKPWEQHYTVGPSANFEVLEKGNFIKSNGKQKGLNKGCNAFKFLDAAYEAAPELEDEIESDGVKTLEDQRVRLTNLDYETVGGDKKKMIVIGAIVEDEAPVKGTSSGGSSATKSSSRGAAAVEEKADAAIVALLEDTPKIKRNDLANALFTANKKDADVKAMMQLCFKDAWVGSDDRSFEWDRKKNVIVAKEED